MKPLSIGAVTGVILSISLICIFNIWGVIGLVFGFPLVIAIIAGGLLIATSDLVKEE